MAGEIQVRVLGELGEKIENAGLDRGVTRRDHLVTDQKLGLGSQRAGDRNALALAARELIGTAFSIAGVEFDLLQQRLRPVPSLCSVQAEEQPEPAAAANTPPS